MFNTCQEAVNWVTSRRKSKQPLSNFKDFILENNKNIDELKFIHVAGTNGKGSTCNFICDCLIEAGYKVGMFTSPHLVTHQDRITINHQWISDEDFLNIVNQRKFLWEKWDLAMFEIDVDLMLVYFAQKKVDIVVLETGLGGLSDATNVIKQPLASVIVSVGLDHMERLGYTIEEITFQKAGIIKEKCPVICGENRLESRNIIEKTSMDKNSDFHTILLPKIKSIQPITFEYKGVHCELKSMATYQVHNACVAIETLLVLNKKGLLSIRLDQIEQGIKKSEWKGRFEVLQRRPLVIVDGAHNEHGIDALVKSIDNLPKPCVLVFAALKDKGYPEMISKLHRCVDEMIITSFDFYRAASLTDLNTEPGLILIEDYKEAIELAKNKVKNKGTVLITGSLYFISEVIAYLKKDEK